MTATSIKIPSAARLRTIRAAAREAGNVALASACFRLLRAKTRRTSGPGLGNQAEALRNDIALVSTAL